MTTIELKQKVIGCINKIENDDLLNDVYKFLEIGDNNQEIYQLSQQHIEAIHEAQEQIKQDQYLTNEQANKEIDKWLKK